MSYSRVILRFRIAGLILVYHVAVVNLVCRIAGGWDDEMCNGGIFCVSFVGGILMCRVTRVL